MYNQLKLKIKYLSLINIIILLFLKEFNDQEICWTHKKSQIKYDIPYWIIYFSIYNSVCFLFYQFNYLF